MNFLINRRISIAMIFLALILTGYVSYKQLAVELTPNAELPTLYVNVRSNAVVDPAYMEANAVIPLEGAISTVDGVERIESTAGTQSSEIRVDFKRNVNLKHTTLRLEEKVNAMVSDLPTGFSVSINKVNLTRVSNSLMNLQVRGSGGVDYMRNLVDTEILPELENIDGIAQVNVFGGRHRAIEVQMNMDAADALGITPQRVSALLTQNAQERAFAGYVVDGAERFFVHVNSSYGSVAEIENIVIAPGPILLKDIATIFFDLKDQTSISRVNGMDAISVSLVNDAQVNLIEASHRALAVVESLNKRLAPQNVEIVVQDNSAETIENNINQIAELGVIGALLAVVILWFFLRNLRLVVLIALAIPISVFAAFNLFYAFGISINSLTLIGMALAVGMLLDNSIVVMENIYRLSGQGLPPQKATTQGTREVVRSIIAATLTTVTVFMPFLFADNAGVRLLGEHIGVSIISTLCFSLMVALLFVPMASYTMLSIGKKSKRIDVYEKVSIRQRIVQIYLTILKTALRNPGVTIGAAVLTLIIVYTLAVGTTTNMRREVDSETLRINATMFAGTDLEATDEIVKGMEEKLAGLPEMKELIVRIWEAQASFTLVLDENYARTTGRTMTEIKTDVQERLADTERTQVRVNNMMVNTDESAGLSSFLSMMGIGDNRERIVMVGSDYDIMDLVANDIEYYLEELESISDVQMSSQGGRQPEINLNFDQILTTSYSITPANISSGLSDLNRVITSEASLKLGDESYDIVIRELLSPEEEQRVRERGLRSKTVDDLRAVQVPNADGALYELQSLAEINYGRGAAQIRRVNQNKEIIIYVTFDASAEESRELLEGYRAEVRQLLEDYNTPPGVAMELVEGEDEFADFYFLIFAAGIFIYMILAAVFESLTTPLVLLFAIPLAAIGSLIALVLTNTPLQNANVLMGCLILLGVVVNNGIILIDYANLLRKRGYTRNRALISAGLARMRPIIITSVTTIVAMTPMAMGGAEYAGAIGSPFAITVIGGLAFSALLTLIFVPTVYIGLENALGWYRSQSRKTYIVHAILFLIGVLYIYFRVYGIGAQLLWLLGLIVIIPGVTYFAQTSLRKASIDKIRPDDELRIEVRNLVKIYDWPNRFARQWQSGINIRRRMGLGGDFHNLKDFRNVLWQVAVMAFLIYFGYFFMSEDNTIWIFLISMIIYFMAVSLWGFVMKYLRYNHPGKSWVKWLNRIVYWGLPLFFLFLFSGLLGNPSLVIVIGFVWIVALVIRYSSNYLYNNDINIERIEGRFGSLKRSYFRIIKTIPVLGRRKKPFKALRGVSFDIKTGMFGLLGPNGAGKSTFIRILSGILDQSYGTIWINGLNTRQYREELQGLIGFLPQEFGTYENMTSWEFLDYQAMLKGITDPVVRSERLEYVLTAVHMIDRKDAKIGSFSGGMKQRIGIALILLNLPRILIVDEPTAGLDPRERIRFRNLLVELSRERIVVFSTHIIEDISSSCNQVVVINKGQLKYFGVPQQMVDIARNKVWQFNITEDDFEKYLDKSLVTHHIQDGREIRVRYISPTKPYEGAVSVEPNLEDAYLCLLKNM